MPYAHGGLCPMPKEAYSTSYESSKGYMYKSCYSKGDRTSSHYLLT